MDVDLCVFVLLAGRPAMRTRNMLYAYWRNGWGPDMASAWAMRMLEEGFDTPDICMLAARPDFPWDRAKRSFAKACDQLGLSDDIDRDIQQVTEREWLAAYRNGEVTGAILMWTLPEMQQRLGLPQVIHQSDLKTGIGRDYTIEGLEGAALETLIRRTLKEHGLLDS